MHNVGLARGFFSEKSRARRPHYEMVATVEIPEQLEPAALRAALEAVADRLVLDVELAPL